VTSPFQQRETKWTTSADQIAFLRSSLVRFSLHTYDREANAWIASDREEVKFVKWLPAGTLAP
jgi:hypothetical protein